MLRKRSIIKLFVTVFSILLFFIVFSSSLYYFWPRSLIKKDKEEKCEAMFILNLSTPRLDYGISVYKKGLVNKVVVVPGEALKSTVIQILGLRLKTIDVYGQIIDYLVVNGIPRENIIFDKTIVHSTYEEAQSILSVCEEYDFKSLILVTSAFHSSRSKYIFKKIFPRNFKLISLPVPLEKEGMSLKNWHQREKELVWVFLETFKYIFYIIKY